MKDNDKRDNPYKSPIPPHLTPEEREIWEKEYEWEQQEHERRKKEGWYDPPRKKTKGWRSIANLFKGVRLW